MKPTAFTSDRRSNLYLHHFEHEDGTVITIRDSNEEPTTEMLKALPNYQWIHSEVNA